MNPPACPYCNAEAKLVDSAVVYGRSFGPIWLCPNYPDCDTYVGVHKGTQKPLGTLANAELREWRKSVHAAFDPLWKGGPWSRDRAYRWLQAALDLPRDQCHIAMFDIAQCQAALEAIEGVTVR